MVCLYICHGEQIVKRISNDRRFLLLILVGTLLASTGCSWLTNRRSLFSSDDKKSDRKNAIKNSVSKKQYDQLLVKYEQLLLERRKISPEESLKTTSDKDLLKELKKVHPKKEENLPSGTELAETVDVFARDPESKFPNLIGELEKRGDVEEELQKYLKAKKYIASNQFNESLKLLKEIESSKTTQIRVQAKYLLGEILFKQKEYDLSMQVFEEIIQEQAFSGVVIKVLGRLIVCSEKLKLTKKKERYYSLLHDFFEKA